MSLCLCNGNALGFQRIQITTTTTHSIFLNKTVIYQKAHDTLSVCAGVWVGSRRLQEETDRTAPTRAFLSVLLFAFCSRSAANILIPKWKMSWGNSIYEHVIGPAATNVFPLGPYLNLAWTDSHHGHIRHYSPAASDCHLFPFGTGCSIIAPTPTQQFMKLQFFHMPPLFLSCKEVSICL